MLTDQFHLLSIPVSPVMIFVDVKIENSRQSTVDRGLNTFAVFIQVITQRSTRTLLNLCNNFLCRSSFRSNPWLPAWIKYRWQAMKTIYGMNAQSIFPDDGYFSV